MTVVSPAVVLSLLVLVAALAYAHVTALVGMKSMWDGTPMYSFGYIVPFVAAYLVWTRRDALARIVPQPAYLAGGVVLAGALGLLVGGHLGGILIAQQLAVVVSLTAVVLLVWGWPALRLVWMALAYLLLIVPFWDAFTEPLHLPFQRLSANLGVQMLHAVGVPAHREGVFLYLPNITLEVARACSGVNYLIAILALGVPLAYLYLPTNGRRVLLIGSAVAIAALSNSLRVGLIGALSYFEFSSALHGPMHVLHGLFVSGIGYVVLFVGLRLLSTPEGQASTAPSAGAAAIPATDARAAGRLAIRASALAAVFLLVGFVPMRSVAEPVTIGRPLATLPDQLGDWVAEPTATSTETWWRGADDELFRRYRSGSGQVVDLSVAYFATQTQGRELSSHYTGALHRWSSGEPAALDASGDATVNVVALRPRDGSQETRHGFFWYELDGHTQTSPYEVKARTLWNAAVHQRTNGGIVVLLTPPSEAPPAAEQLRALRDLAGHVHTALRSILSVGSTARAGEAAARP